MKKSGLIVLVLLLTPMILAESTTYTNFYINETIQTKGEIIKSNNPFIIMLVILVILIAVILFLNRKKFKKK